MDSQEMTLPNPRSQSRTREVEFELRRPHKEDLALPKVELEPLRRAAEDILLTGIGLTVLAGRLVINSVQAAHRAGREAAERPGPVTRALLRVVAQKESPSEKPLSRSIPVLPIAHYTTLGAEEIIARLPGLEPEQLMVLRDHELGHQRRPQVLEALDELLGAMD